MSRRLYGCRLDQPSERGLVASAAQPEPCPNALRSVCSEASKLSPPVVTSRSLDAIGIQREI